MTISYQGRVPKLSPPQRFVMDNIHEQGELVVRVRVVYTERRGFSKTHLPYIKGREIRQRTLDALVEKNLLSYKKETFEGDDFISIRHIYQIPR
jgi:hypothetical protein